MAQYLDHTALAQKLLDQQGQIQDLAKERDQAYRERAQLLAWLAALHPATTVIAPAPDIDEPADMIGWLLLYLVAGGWQMTWHIHPHDAHLFDHVERVDVADTRAVWDGHSTDQKYGRMRSHIRSLAHTVTTDDQLGQLPDATEQP